MAIAWGRAPTPGARLTGWLSMPQSQRRELKRRDLADLLAKRAPLGKTAYRQRVRAVLRRPATQAVARRFAADMQRACKAVVRSQGRSVKA